YTLADAAKPKGNGVRQQREGQANGFRLLNERALAHLDAWVPALFPTAKRTRAGGYRVKSADLGRGREEDLSLTPKGIKYFGDHDMGDPRQGRRSPIDCVMEWGHHEFASAVEWLENKLDAEQQQPKPAAAGPVFDPWERHIVPAFPLDILPPVAQEFVS